MARIRCNNSRRDSALRLPISIGIALGLTILSSHLWAGELDRSVELSDFGLTLQMPAGARAAAMAGSYTSSGNDAISLVYNPAGLARIRRPEATLGIHQETTEAANSFYGNRSALDNRNGAADVIALAFPVPVYRGSFVAAIGMFRQYSGYLDMFYSGFNPAEGTDDRYLLQQSGSLYGYTAGIGVDLSSALSGGISLMIIDGQMNKLTQWDHTAAGPPMRTEFLTDDVTLDFDGYVARAGIQIFPHPIVQFGAAFTSPTLFQVSGNGVTEEVGISDNALDTFRRTEGEIDTDYLLPFRFDVGATVYPIEPLQIVAELGYSDWTEAAIDQRRFRTRLLDTVFSEVLDLRFAAEWSLQSLPVRVRAGFARRPNPLRFVQTDRIDFDRLVKADDGAGGRREWGVGIGGLVGGVLSIDVAMTYTSESRTTATFSNDRSYTRYLLTTTYRP